MLLQFIKIDFFFDIALFSALFLIYLYFGKSNASNNNQPKYNNINIALLLMGMLSFLLQLCDQVSEHQSATDIFLTG